MRIGIITTSRADYGIYRSVLEALRGDDEISYGLLVSGTHFSRVHGFTVEEIESDGHPIWARLPLNLAGDGAFDIATAAAEASTRFAEAYAALSNLDLLIALGDRYEMFGAVAAAVPFNLPVAHLHGGETTQGAIDDKYRHAITMLADVHFTATADYRARVVAMTGSEWVYHVGALALDGIEDLELPTTRQLMDRFGLDFLQPTVLVTFHPETVAYGKNTQHATILVETLTILSERYQIVLSLPNADTASNELRTELTALADKNPRVYAIEHFGKLNYFAAMREARFLLGNSSSAIIEAPSLQRYAINLGRRQVGRVRSANIIDAAVDRLSIFAAVTDIERRGFTYMGDNVYYKNGRAGEIIVDRLKAFVRSKPLAHVR